MEYYYGIMFIVVAIFQEQIEGFVVSLTCSIVGFVSSALIGDLVTSGYNFFYASVLVDVFMMIIAVNVLSHTIGKVLLIASLLSLLFNLFMWHNFKIDTAHIYDIIKPFYGIVNIIIFEILLYTCILHSKIYPWVKVRIKKFNDKYLPDKYKKFVTKEK